MSSEPGPRWTLDSSIAVEVELVTDAASQYLGRDRDELVSDYVGMFLQDLAPDWVQAWEELRSKAGGSLAALVPAVSLAQALYESDYGKATLRARELRVTEAYERAVAAAVPWGLEPITSLSLPDRLADLLVRHKLSMFAEAGITWSSTERKKRELQRTMSVVPRILRGGDLHSRFWHLLDRFYYEVYAPWRRAREPIMEQAEVQALQQLGARTGEGIPRTDWLPDHHPLNNLPELRETIAARNLVIHLLVEPIGLPGFIGVQPDSIIVSCAQDPLVPLDWLRQVAEETAEGLKALADSSRLLILRSISEVSLSNTQMGNNLGLSRSTVSIHCKVLREAGLIESGTDGRTTRHTINVDAVRNLFARVENLLLLPHTENDVLPDATGELRTQGQETDEPGPVL